MTFKKGFRKVMSVALATAMAVGLAVTGGGGSFGLKSVEASESNLPPKMDSASAINYKQILGGAVEGNGAVKIIERLRQEESALTMVTPYMFHNFIEGLIMIGEKNQALKEMEEYWGGMLKEGADTFWELYNPKNPNESPYGGTIVNSYCHAWSCGPTYFLRKYFCN